MDRRKLPNRQSLRLQGYDYSRPGFYFITICVQNMKHIFGNVIDGTMVLNEFGEVAIKYWSQIEIKYRNARIDEFVVMPNHIHGIIEIMNTDPLVRAIRESPVPMDADKESIRKYRRKMLIPKIIGF